MHLMSAPLPPPASPPVRPGPALPSWPQLRAIADCQRYAIWAFLAQILAFALLWATSAAGGLVWIVIMLLVRLQIAGACYRLSKALGSRVAILWGVGGFLPNVIGLVVIAVLSVRATRRLRSVGLKVGFLGTKLPAEPPPGVLTAEVSQIFS
jgi:hypothetical protein